MVILAAAATGIVPAAGYGLRINNFKVVEIPHHLTGEGVEFG